MKILNLRYKIDHQLHTDNCGTVYAARDMLQQDKLLCLRVFTSEYSKTDYIQSLVSNFMFLKSVRHPNLTELYEFDRLTTVDHKASNKIRYFYTYEYLEDIEVEDYRQLSVDDTKDGFVELMRVISYLHFRGIVYQFLNFITTTLYFENKRIHVKLKDLITIGLFKDNHTISEYQISLFIPPEVVWSQHFDYSSDIYALGHMLYYLHYRIDYEKNPLNDIFDKDSYNDNEINKLIRKMVSNYVEDRSYDISHLVQDYSDIHRMSVPFDDHIYYNKIHFGSKLVGREKDFEEVYNSVIDKIDKKATGNGIIISGESGIGKSRFLRELSYILKMRGYDNITVDLTTEHHQDFALFTQILRSIFRKNDVPLEMVHKYGGELSKLVSEIGQRYKISPGEVLEGERENLKVANRIFNFLIDYSLHRPLLFIIDNIDLANKYDLIILDYIFRNQKDLQLYVVTSVNKNTLDENTSVSLWEDSNRLRYLQLNKFNYEDANQLIKHILGMNKKPINFTTRVMRDAEGNPRKIEEIIQNLYLNKKIYVQQHKQWYIADIDNLEELEFSRDSRGEVSINLEVLDPLQREILNVASVFSDAVDYDILERMLGPDIMLTEHLNALIEVNILSEKFGDFGYTYNFNNRHLADGINRLLRSEDKRHYHERIAVLLEDDFMTKQHFVMESLIYHLKLSDQIDKAVKYCFLAAQRMKEINIYSQAISFYKRAIELRVQNDQEEMVPVVLNKIAEINMLLGQLHEAEINYEEASKISRRQNKVSEYVDALNGLTAIATNKAELSRAYNYYNEAHRVAIENGYVDGELQAAYHQCKIFLVTNDLDSIATVANHYLKVATEMKREKYIGLFLNEKGISLSYTDNRIQEAIGDFTESYRILSEIGEHISSTSALNNLSVVLLDEMADIIGARNNFEKIIEYYETYNIIRDKAIMLNNIGETYFLENRYVEAQDFYNIAYKLAEETNDDHMGFLLLTNLCRNYIETADYDKAYLLLKKLEVDYQNDKNRGLDVVYYFHVHVEYFLKIKNLEMAEKWLSQYQGIGIEMPTSIELIMEILNFKIRYYKENYLNAGKSIDIVWLKNICSRVKSAFNIKLVREMILEIGLDMIHSRKFILVQELMGIENQFMPIYDTLYLKALRKIIEIAYENNRELHYELLLESDRVHIADEHIWVVYKAVGDEYFTLNNYFKSISNYMMAFDVLHKLTQRIPVNHRDSYIMNDESKLDLKYRINELKRRIMGSKSNEKTSLYNELEVSSSEEFFNLTDLTDLYKNQKFLKTVQQIYFEKYDTKFEHINDLIRCLQSDELHNIKQMLLYFVQYCFADRGYVIMVDENGNQQEFIKSSLTIPEPDVNTLLKNMASDDDGIIISFIEQNTNSPLLGKHLKGIICIPIAKIQGNEEVNLETDRRRNVYQPFTKDRLGYIYLETDNIFNNFSRESYKHIKTLMNLLFVMIDSYNLKKISSIDKLTGVYLRKYFEDLMMLEMNRAKGNGTNFSMVMCDIDKFKSVNDSFGHRKGDEILRRIGQTLNGTLRISDLVGRYGGEEFVILLPMTSSEEALEVCEKVRIDIERQKMLGSDFPLTMSFGISSYPDHGTSEEELLEKADQALYFSKNNGRNKTTLWDPNIGNEGVRFDKLAGILSGNISKDTRNVQAIVNVLGIIRELCSPSERMAVYMDNLIDVTEATQGTVLIYKDGILNRWYGKVKGSVDWLEQIPFDLTSLTEFANKEQGEYYINWNDLDDIDLESGIPKWKSIICVPQKLDFGEKAVMIFSVPISEKEFDFADYNFVSTMSGLLNTIAIRS